MADDNKTVVAVKYEHYERLDNAHQPPERQQHIAQSYESRQIKGYVISSEYSVIGHHPASNPEIAETRNYRIMSARALGLL